MCLSRKEERKNLVEVEVLVATMNQKDTSLLEKMNIQSDALVGNQCDSNKIEEIVFQGHRVVFYNFCEKGVGLNRNNTLMRSNGDFCLFADDDMVFEEGYPEMVLQQFQKHVDADVLIFNLREKNTTRYIIKKPFRVRWYNYMRFGAARVAIRRKSIFDNGILFNLTFGGGTERGHGEDTLFLGDCLKKGLKIYAVPQSIARLTEERKSTWFVGYDDKYLENQGDLYYCISRRWYKVLCLQDAFRHRKVYQRSTNEAYRTMTRKRRR